MKLVIDANILFAALISQGFTADLIASPKLELFCLEFIFIEFEKYKTYLLEKTHREPEEFMKFFTILKRNIKTILFSEFEDYYEHAKELSPDPKDALYFGLALKMNTSIWTNDKRLKNQKEIKVLDTSDIVRILKSGEK